MRDQETAVLEPGSETTEAFSLEVVDVTGSYHVLAEDLDRSTPAGAVAKALANRLSLPENVPWQLREDETSAFLDDRKPIGEQVSPGARVTVVPQTHLGAGG